MRSQIPFSLCSALCLILALPFVVHSPPTGAQAQRAPSAPGAAPLNCPLTPASHHLFDDVFGPVDGVGASPVWAGSAYLPPVIHRTAFKVLWLLEPGQTNVVTLRGWNLLTGKPIRFAIPVMGIGGAVRGRLDRSKGMGPSSAPEPEGWVSFPSSLTLPSSGCYVLFAQWSTGSWIIPFAAGR